MLSTFHTELRSTSHLETKTMLPPRCSDIMWVAISNACSRNGPGPSRSDTLDGLAFA